MALVTYKTLGQVRSGWASQRLVATARAITSNVVLVTSATNHNLVVGDRVYMFGAGPGLDGVQVVTEATSATTFKFATTAATATSVALGGAYFQTMKTGTTGVKVTNVVRADNLLTVTTETASGVAPNEYVQISAGTTTAAGLYKVIEATTSTSFKVFSFGPALSSTNFSPGDNLAALSRVPAVTIYQPAASKSGLISSLVLFNATEQNVTVDLYQTPSTEWSSLADKDKYILQGDTILAPKETYSLNLAMTIANQDRIVMLADYPGVNAFAYGTEFE